MIKVLVLLCILLSCSSLPDKSYSKTKIKSIYTNYLVVADNARVNQNHKLALTYYDKAIEYANLRNDRKDVGIIRLKKAHIFLKENNIESFNNELSTVKKMISIEKINIQDEYNFIKAKQLYNSNKTEQANDIIKSLISKHSESFEKETFYNFQYQKYNSDYMTTDLQKKKVSELVELFEDSELENIEVLSFTFYEYCRSLQNRKSATFEKEVQRALEFYQTIENQRRIKNCYALLAEFHNNDIEKKNYYLSLSK